MTSDRSPELLCAAIAGLGLVVVAVCIYALVQPRIELQPQSQKECTVFVRADRGSQLPSLVDQLSKVMKLAGASR